MKFIIGLCLVVSTGIYSLLCDLPQECLATGETGNAYILIFALGLLIGSFKKKYFSILRAMF
ncbi:MAG: hypothetical protein ACI9BF_000484 [Candidatus Paceibacteria bacterium]|jgi:hypothetical protein